MQTSVALFRLKTRKLLPLYLQRTGNVEEWLRMRAIDAHRTNSRLLKRALRLRHRDDVSTVLHFNGVTTMDTYWVKLQGSDLCYEDIRFKHNYFDGLALRGDADSFNQAPGRTPELTNMGSFEKCWRRLNGVWWLYTAGNAAERFTEVFSSTLAAVIHMDAEKYELDGTYVRSRDFTDGASCNFETAVGIIGDQSEYADIFATLHAIDSRLAESFTYMVFFDAILFNMDRREHNWGVLRDVHTGTILRLAPLFDILRSLPADIRGCATDDMTGCSRISLRSSPGGNRVLSRNCLCPRPSPRCKGRQSAWRGRKICRWIRASTYLNSSTTDICVLPSGSRHEKKTEGKRRSGSGVFWEACQWKGRFAI